MSPPHRPTSRLARPQAIIALLALAGTAYGGPGSQPPAGQSPAAWPTGRRTPRRCDGRRQAELGDPAGAGPGATVAERAAGLQTG